VRVATSPQTSRASRLASTYRQLQRSMTMPRKRTMAWLAGSVAGGGLFVRRRRGRDLQRTISGSRPRHRPRAVLRSGSALSTADTSGVTCKQVLSGTTGTSGRPPSGYVTTDTLTITKALPAASARSGSAPLVGDRHGPADVKLVNTVKTGTPRPLWRRSARTANWRSRTVRPLPRR